MGAIEPRYFRTVGELRRWFATHYAHEPELWVGFYKKGRGPQKVGYLEALEEALCFGWIDTTVRRVDEDRYAQRFAPRRPQSVWSPENQEKALRLIREGRMRPPGRDAFEGRDRARAARSAQERAISSLETKLLTEFRAQPVAWTFFSAQAPSYRRLFSRWIMSARGEETRRLRLARLIQASARGKRLDPLTLRAEK
jgi:uncharacterized protein YdeI (YjbR/CyaY-like superfamily)